MTSTTAEIGCPPDASAFNRVEEQTLTTAPPRILASEERRGCGRILPLIAALTIFAGSLGCTHKTADSSKPVAVTSQTVGDLRKVLPGGWDLEVNQDVICVKRRAPVEARAIYPSMSVDLDNRAVHPTIPWFMLAATEFVSPKAREAMKTRNAELEAEGLRFHRDARVADIPHEQGKVPVHEFKFHPRTPAEAETIREYKAIYAEIRRLPDLYANGQSYFFFPKAFWFVHDEDRREYLMVEDLVLGVFAQYEKRDKAVPEPRSFQGTLIMPK